MGPSIDDADPVETTATDTGVVELYHHINNPLGGGPGTEEALRALVEDNKRWS